MHNEPVMTFAQLTALARHSENVAMQCAYAAVSFAGWERVPVSFPAQLMRHVGTLVEDPYSEATYEEFLPSGTNYWSENAPIALRHFPYNRCVVDQCASCGRAYLRYTETGGYYVEPRIRALVLGLIVDPSPLDRC